jgi:hypothetical protein
MAQGVGPEFKSQYHKKIVIRELESVVQRKRLWDRNTQVCLRQITAFNLGQFLIYRVDIVPFTPQNC